MDRSTTAVAASGDVAASSTSPDVLHHHAWLVLQTGLGHAPRAVLHTIVEAHAHFQARSDDHTFFMARSRLEPILPRGMQWRTFTNHRTALVKLGLLELVWRAPNQHSDKSRWRIRYDRTFSAQPREQLVLPFEEFGAQMPVAEPDDLSDLVLDEFEADVPTTDAESPSGQSGERACLVRQIVQMKSWLATGERRLAELEARFDALVAAELESQKGAGSEPATVPRAERRRRARLVAKQARRSRIDPDSPFLQAVITAMTELSVTLADDDLARFREVEELWRERHSGDIPDHFLAYAVRRMREAKRDRPVGYVLGVLRSTVRKGYTEDRPSGEEMQPEGRRYGVRTKRY